MSGTNQYLEDKILLCEDDPILRLNIASMLEMEGFQVYQAANGYDGIQLLGSKRIALIISDWAMPVMDGLELLKAVKQRPTTSHIPFIFLTARTTVEDKLNALDLMADDYITKPFSMKELLLKCRNNIENRKRILKSNISFSGSEGAVYESRDQKFLSQIKAFIEKNLSNENLSLEDFGKEFPMSISSIQKNMKRICGKSLFQLIQETRLLKAKAMIEADSAAISEILYHCGFNSHNHFTRKFKEHFGVLPSQLRKGASGSDKDIFLTEE